MGWNLRYSEFAIPDSRCGRSFGLEGSSRFGVRNSEFRVRNSEFRIRSSEWIPSQPLTREDGRVAAREWLSRGSQSSEPAPIDARCRARESAVREGKTDNWLPDREAAGIRRFGP